MLKTIKEETIKNGGMTTWPTDNPSEYDEKVPKKKGYAVEWEPDWRTTVIDKDTTFMAKWEEVEIFVDSNHFDSPFLGYDSTGEEIWVSYAIRTKETKTYISYAPNTIGGEELIRLENVTPTTIKSMKLDNVYEEDEVLLDGYGIKKIYKFSVKPRTDTVDELYYLYLQPQLTEKGKEIYGNLTCDPIILKQRSIYEGEGDAGIGGELCLYDKSKNRFISVSKNGLQSMVSLLTLDKVKNDYTPIGIIVVPINHYRYDKNKKIGGVVSLNAMSSTTPIEGAPNGANRVEWGPVSSVTFPTFSYVIHYGPLDDEQMKVVGTVDCSRLPSDYFTGTPSKRYPRLYYSTNSASKTEWYAGPSPYNPDGTANPDYTMERFEGGRMNALSDFDGQANTYNILRYVSKTYTPEDFTSGRVSSIPLQDYPAATACNLYSSIDKRVPSGKWYLPSVGELGYLMANLKKFNDTLDYANTIWPGTSFSFTRNEGIWTSTVYANGTKPKARTINALHGKVGNYDFTEGNWIRAFTQVEIY